MVFGLYRDRNKMKNETVRPFFLSVAFVLGLLPLSVAACSSVSGESTTDGPSKPTEVAAGGSGGGQVGGVPPVKLDIGDGPVPPADPIGDCGSTHAGATLVREPVDIILVVDNSGSMADEILGVQANINVNFAKVLASANIDYRVILIARHGSAVADNSVCIEAPLSGALSCDPLPPAPALTDRFFQYNMKIDSHDTFVKLIGAYRAPFEDTIFKDKSKLTEEGWHVYLRPGVRKVFLELTDDDPEDMSWQDFDANLLKIGPEHFGTKSARKYAWHSIVGMGAKPNPLEAWLPGDPIQQGLCGMVESAGVPYQELSRLTGGLRFPLCRPDAYDVVFKEIATNVIQSTEVACDFAIPAPPTGEVLDLEKVAVSYSAGPASPAAPVTYAQARDRNACEPNAFFIENDRIFLCPDACSILQANPLASVDVLFTCESTVIVR